MSDVFLLPSAPPRADYPGGVILAVDTSLGTAVAVVHPDGRECAEASAVDPLGHAEVIGELLQAALTVIEWSVYSFNEPHEYTLGGDQLMQDFAAIEKKES